VYGAQGFSSHVVDWDWGKHYLKWKFPSLKIVQLWVNGGGVVAHSTFKKNITASLFSSASSLRKKPGLLHCRAKYFQMTCKVYSFRLSSHFRPRVLPARKHKCGNLCLQHKRLIKKL